MPWSSLFENTWDRLRNIFTGSSPSDSPPWTRHEANATVHKCLSTRDPPIPNEIILQILDQPSRWIRTRVISARVATDNEPIRVGSGLHNNGEQQILATNPLTHLEAQRIRRVVYSFRSRDQGWSSYPNQHGSFDGSFSWFEASLTHPFVSNDIASAGLDQQQLKAAKERTRYELQRNRHAGGQPESYRHVLGLNHELLQHVEDGDSIVLWARASFPGWENRVFSAGIEVWCLDDLSGTMNSTA